MQKSDVFDFYRKKGLAGPRNGILDAVAGDLGITTSYVSQWPDLLPEKMALRLHLKYRDELPFDPNEYK